MIKINEVNLKAMCEEYVNGNGNPFIIADEIMNDELNVHSSRESWRLLKINDFYNEKTFLVEDDKTGKDYLIIISEGSSCSNKKSLVIDEVKGRYCSLVQNIIKLEVK